MANFSFYQISCNSFKDEKGDPVVIDNVTIQITKKVNNSTMRGLKGENYSVPVVDLPFLFESDVKFPARNGDDCTRRVEAIKEFLDGYVGRDVIAEEISKGKSKILTSLEFID